MLIYYNPRCSKCREAKDLLEQNNCSVEIRDYLNEPPSQKELKDLLSKLGCKAIDIVRKSEPVYIEKFKGKTLTNTQWIKTLSEHPILIERPILVNGDEAIVGRPPSLVLNLVKSKKKK